jgi:hypothetical protein
LDQGNDWMLVPKGLTRGTGASGSADEMLAVFDV